MAKFTFLESYYTTIQELSKGDEELANKLLHAIINYGLNWIEPDDPIIKAIMVQIKIMIDKGNEISKKRSNANAQRKTNKENAPQQTKTENKTKTETKKWPDPEVEECISLIKEANGGLMDGTQANGRKYSMLLIKKFKTLTSVANGKYTRQATLKVILDIVKENKFHKSKITSPELIYRNLAILMQVCKDTGQKITNQTALKVI